MNNCENINKNFKIDKLSDEVYKKVFDIIQNEIYYTGSNLGIHTDILDSVSINLKLSFDTYLFIDNKKGE